MKKGGEIFIQKKKIAKSLETKVETTKNRKTKNRKIM